MSSVFQALHYRSEQLAGARRVWVAYSGGLDSTVLLHQLVELGLKNLVAVHVNHQLSSRAQGWSKHCVEQAKSWGVRCEVHTVVVASAGEGLESAAREARFNIFNRLVEASDILLTGHHANDQAETLVFRLMRGAGLKGMSGMPPQRVLNEPLGAGLLLRPLLNVTREALAAYAADQQLSWVEDHSNADTRFDRNFLRQEVLPLIEQRWPKAVKRIASSAQLLQQSHALLDDYLSEDLKQCLPVSERVGHSLDLTVLSGFSLVKQNHLLRYWLDSLNVRLPTQAQLSEIHKVVMAADDAFPQVSWGRETHQYCDGCSVHRFRQRLYIVPRLPVGGRTEVIVTWDGVGECMLNDGFVLGAIPSETGFGLPAGRYQIQTRQGGERCRPEQRARSQTLKKLLQEFELEPWLRDRVPLIYRDETLVAVGDLWVCQGVAVEGGAALSWAFKPAS